MFIVFSVVFAALLMLAAKGCAYLVNARFGPLIQTRHLQLVALPVIVCVVMLTTPSLMDFFGFERP